IALHDDFIRNHLRTSARNNWSSAPCHICGRQVDHPLNTCTRRVGLKIKGSVSGYVAVANYQHALGRTRGWRSQVDCSAALDVHARRRARNFWISSVAGIGEHQSHAYSRERGVRIDSELVWAVKYIGTRAQRDACAAAACAANADVAIKCIGTCAQRDG